MFVDKAKVKPMPNINLLDPFDAVQKLVASFAFFVGGVWVLMNYVRNRTHVPRLQVEVVAKLIKCEDRHYLLATCTAKNVGLSKFELRQPHGAVLRGTALLVTRVPLLGVETVIIEAPWEDDVAAFDIFTEHLTVEPGLTISEEKLICLGESRYEAYRVKLRVSAHKEKWTAVAVAVRPPDPRNELRKE